jgi:Amt family ammonium transporter
LRNSNVVNKLIRPPIFFSIQLLTSTGLVYMMTPALACFYGGLVENKNFFNQLFLSVVCMGIVPIEWCLFGYSSAFGPGNSAFGSFNYASMHFIGLDNLYGENPDEFTGSTIPALAFVSFQCAFAIITPALISGAVVGRMKIIPYMLFIFLWSIFCYNSLARWIFSSRGWLNKMGTLDFAGGLVVHLASGMSGLVAALILGSRAQFDPDVVSSGQTKLPFTILGTGLLWVGWMGFNGGSSLGANGKKRSCSLSSDIWFRSQIRKQSCILLYFLL